MVVKELDTFVPTGDKLASAGRAAEEQMAFYLRRALANEPHIYVCNGIRLDHNGDAAQIDHMVLLPWSIVLIESKSVTTRVKINDHGEWTRWINGSPRGMPSPILQARRQGEFLRSYFNRYAKELRDRALFRQRDFSTVPLDILVAISDSGIVERPKRLQVTEVCKADQVVEHICGLVAHYHARPHVLSSGELQRLCVFLVEHHKPAVSMRGACLELPASRDTNYRGGSTDRASRSQPSKDQRCRHCGGAKLAVRHGRYGYYLKCQQCAGNTHIDTRCAQCGSEKTITKDGAYYLADCKRCATSTLLFPLSLATPTAEGRRPTTERQLG